MSNKKTYWKGPEELAKDPNYLKNVANEFPQDLPMEEFLGDVKAMANSSTSRRDFLKFTGFTLAAATLAACESPVVKTIPYVNKPENVTPGLASWYASAYYDGLNFGSILVKSREGRPIYIKGNKQYGIAGGALHPRITASVLSLYDSARLQAPQMNGKESNWKKVDAEVSKGLADVISGGGKVYLLTNTIISPSTQDAIIRFTNKLNGKAVESLNIAADTDTSAAVTPVTANAEMAPVAAGENVKWVQYDAISYNAIRDAHQKSFGPADKPEDKTYWLIPDYNFAKAKVVVGVNADFLGNWMLSNQNSAGYMQNRKAENEWMSKHFQFETNLSLTGSNADVRVPIKPSEEGQVIAALYQHATGKSAGKVSDAIMKNTKAAGELLKNSIGKGETLIVAGSNDVNVQILVNALNFELGNYNSSLNLNNPISMFMGNDAEVEKVISGLTDKDAILIYGCNPVYTLPKSLNAAAKIKGTKLAVSFALYADETATQCDIIAPDHHYLEGWNDASPKADHYAIQQPLIRPLYKTAAWQESLLVWSNQSPRTKDSKGFSDLIKYNWKKYGYEMYGGNQKFMTFEEYWNFHVHNGGNTQAMPPLFTTPLTWTGNVDAAASGIASIKGGEWEVNFYQKIGMGDGQQANNPWLQELPDPISRVTWDNYVTMAPADMEAMGLNMLIAQEYPASTVKVKTGGIEIELPVYPSPGQAPKTIGIALGYGRGANGENIGKSAFQTGQYGDHLEEGGKLVPIGKNVFAATSFVNGYISYNGTASISSTGNTYALASTQTSHTLMERDSVLRETTWNVFKQGTKEDYNPEHKVAYYNKGETSIKEIDLWEKHPIEHIGHRWVMTIDLNSCTGCGNCIIACHAENNVPVVGKDEVRRSRDMHWMRIDRYYSSDTKMEEATAKGEGVIATYAKMEIPSANPQVLFMPLMCQHCNHAPCETVCPVLATTHSKEGINQMTYNRCIGTRYCANNCPYKVRRFNWFNYTDYKKFKNVNPSMDDTARWVLNPDVTVRTRGVMEKCSFCVQRVQEGKLIAKKESRKLVDGDVHSACQESCPTNAIQFGDWNDTESKVRKESTTDRAYMALEEVGVEPNVYYQVKVRNLEGKMPEKKHHAKHDEGHGEEKHGH